MGGGFNEPEIGIASTPAAGANVARGRNVGDAQRTRGRNEPAVGTGGRVGPPSPAS